MPNKSEEYKGYEISWVEPPRSSAMIQVNVASAGPVRQRMLEALQDHHGAAVISGSNIAGALARAKALVDRLS